MLYCILKIKPEAAADEAESVVSVILFHDVLFLCDTYQRKKSFNSGKATTGFPKRAGGSMEKQKELEEFKTQLDSIINQKQFSALLQTILLWCSTPTDLDGSRGHSILCRRHSSLLMIRP